MKENAMKNGQTKPLYITESVRYQAKNCSGYLLHDLYSKAQGNRVIEVNQRLKAYKEKAAELLTSKEDVRHRGRRCIGPEAVFGQIKNNMAYHCFRHFGKDRITMDFSFLTTAFNIKNLCGMLLKGGFKLFHTLENLFFLCILLISRTSNDFFEYKQIKIAT